MSGLEGELLEGHRGVGMTRPVDATVDDPDEVSDMIVVGLVDFLKLQSNREVLLASGFHVSSIGAPYTDRDFDKSIATLSRVNPLATVADWAKVAGVRDTFANAALQGAIGRLIRQMQVRGPACSQALAGHPLAYCCFPLLTQPLHGVW